MSSSAGIWPVFACPNGSSMSTLIGSIAANSRASGVSSTAGAAYGGAARPLVLERGSLGGVSAGVLDAIARALQLDPAERAHLFHLAQAADGTSAIIRPQGRRTEPGSARPSLQWTLD